MRLHLLVSCLLALSAQSVLADPSPWPASSPTDQAIFCGAPGTETSRVYSEALRMALNELTAKGASLQAAMATVRSRANCQAIAADTAAAKRQGASQ